MITQSVCATRMRAAIIRASAVALVALVACQDPPSAPIAPRTSVRLCGIGPWVAYQNDLGEWTQVADRGDGAFEIPATDRVTFAWSYFPPASPFLVVASLGAAEAETQYACAPVPVQFLLGGFFTGAVRGLASGDVARVFYGGAYGSPIVGSDTALAGFQLPILSGVNDLVAWRYPQGDSTRIDRVIVRRAPPYSAGTTADLDFGSTEALAPAPFVVDWSGPPASVREVLHSNSLGFFALTPFREAPRSSPRTLLALPLAVRAPTDRYEISLTSSDGRRTVALYAQSPRDTVLAFGPDAAAPAITTVASSPQMRVRFDIPLQPEYAGSVDVTAWQFFPSSLGVRLMVSKEFLGRMPTIWSLTMPDLTRMPGLPPEYRIGGGSGMSWSVTAASGARPIFPGLAPDGLTVRSATVYGSWP